jgi:hypothetical protein
VHLRIITDAFVTAIFITAAYAISKKKHHIIFAVALLVPVLLSTWSEYFVNHGPSTL